MPDWKERIRMRLAGLRLDPAREAEIVEELSQHLDQRYEELTRGGLDDAGARELAEQELLDPDVFTRYMRSLRLSHTSPPVTPGGPRGRLLADIWQDLRLAARIMRKQAGLSVAAVLTLALGIGANGAIFALVDAVLLRELPFPGPERVVTINETTEAVPAGRVSPVNMRDWKARSQSIDEIAGFIPGDFGMVMSSPDGAENVQRVWVTQGIFRALGLEPLVGRTFLPEDDAEGETGAVMLAEEFWRTRFDSDPSIVGTTLRFDGEPFTVIGVMPGTAQLLGKTSIWGMLRIGNVPEQARGAYVFETVARLKPDVSIDNARAELATIAESLAQEYPATNEGRGIAIRSLRDWILGGDLRTTSLLFLAVVVFVLLICFANIANLLLTRTAARSNEIAVRSMLGADRKRLQQQFWTENLLLAFCGGIAGLIVAGALLEVAPQFIPTALLPPGIELEFGSRIVVFCAVATVVVGLLFSLATALNVNERSSRRWEPGGSRTVTRRSGTTRELLVGAQIATAIALLYCAGLLSRTLLELDRMERGYEAESVLTMMVDPLSQSYPTPELLLQFYDEVEAEIESLPGVAGAAWTSAIPFGPSMLPLLFFELEGEPVAVPTQRPTVELKVVSGDFFPTLGIPLMAGRLFNDRDVAGNPIVCIVNEILADRYAGGRSAIGQRLLTWNTDQPDAEARSCEIVGVAGSTRSEPDELVNPAQVYLSFRQVPDDDVFLAVRPASNDGSVLASSVRAAIGRIDREQLVSVRNVMTLETIDREATAQYRFRATLVVAFAGLALLLAMVGLFGIVAYSVQRRWREYGVRLALGARPVDVLSQIGRGTLRLVAPGAVAGMAIGLGAGPLLGAMLFGVQPFDPATLAIVVSVLALTIAASVAAPALHATRVDPAETLRSE